MKHVCKPTEGLGFLMLWKPNTELWTRALCRTCQVYW